MFVCVQGKHCVLVDDLIQTGGTLLETGKALLELGALDVSAFCTHGVFPQDAWKKFVIGPFKKVWITDSCPMQVLHLPLLLLPLRLPSPSFSRWVGGLECLMHFFHSCALPPVSSPTS